MARGLAVVRACARARSRSAGRPADGETRPAGDQPAARRVHPSCRRKERPEERLATRCRRVAGGQLPPVADRRHLGADLSGEGLELPRVGAQLLVSRRCRIRHPAAVQGPEAGRVVVSRRGAEDWRQVEDHHLVSGRRVRTTRPDADGERPGRSGRGRRRVADAGESRLGPWVLAAPAAGVGALVLGALGSPASAVAPPEARSGDQAATGVGWLTPARPRSPRRPRRGCRSRASRSSCARGPCRPGRSARSRCGARPARRGCRRSASRPDP